MQNLCIWRANYTSLVNTQFFTRGLQVAHVTDAFQFVSSFSVPQYLIQSIHLQTNSPFSSLMPVQFSAYSRYSSSIFSLQDSILSSFLFSFYTLMFAQSLECSRQQIHIFWINESDHSSRSMDISLQIQNICLLKNGTKSILVCKEVIISHAFGWKQPNYKKNITMCNKCLSQLQIYFHCYLFR